MLKTLKKPSIIPGFGVTLGFTLAYLALVVLIPLSGLFFKSASLTASEFWATITSPRLMHAYKISFGLSFAAALINCVFGLILAWVLARYRFPLKGLVDAMVDLPFALPTAVAGIALTALYAPKGWVGQYIDPQGAHAGLAPALSFIFSFSAALLNNFFLLFLAWMLFRAAKWAAQRYAPKLRDPLDAFGNVPMLFPVLVGLSVLMAFYAPPGWVAGNIDPQGVKVAFAPPGILIALIFIGLPFVVRTIQPILQDAEKELEEAALSLGATRWQTFWQVIFPGIVPALLTGFAMAFARGLGEYGSVIFIAGNIPNVSEIVPLVIVIKLEQYDYAGATAIASVMLVASFLMLFVINWLQKWTGSHSVAR